jgi:3-hydroxy-3-methylglutaryl CoA synthase
MKKIFLIISILTFVYGFSNPKPIFKSHSYVTKINVDTLKPDERKYNWYGKFLTRKEYLDTLSKKFKQFNDSLRKEQGLK